MRRATAWLFLLALLALFVTIPAASGARPAIADAPPPPQHGPGDGGQVPANGPEKHRGHIQVENQQPGSSDWQSQELSRGRGQSLDEETSEEALGHRSSGLAAAPAVASVSSPTASPTPSPWTDTTIRGYADQTSINKGQAITLYVGTSLASYSGQVYRMGWYGGAGARLIASIPQQAGNNQAVLAPDAATGIVALNWQPSYTLQTGADWVTGVYLVKLTAADGTVSYIDFVLRDDSLHSDILYQVPVATYEAYNNWGGKSLYDFNSSNSQRAYKVSYDRPYAVWSGAGPFFDGDYTMIRWLESQGYSISYVTSIDLQTRTTQSLFSGHKVFLSPWHDEYWSKQMRDNVTAARDAGVNLAWLDANNIYMQIRFEPSASNVANRVEVCYKDQTLDPIASVTPSLTTVAWRDPIVNQPENALIGILFESNWQYGVSFPWVVSNANNWVYSGTGLQNGQTINGLVGYEYDRFYDNGFTPAGLTTLAASPVIDSTNVPGTQNGSIYQASSGAWVFAAGTIYWAWKLDDNAYQSHGADSRVQRMTSNVLSVMINGGSVPTPAPTPTPSPLALTVFGDSIASGWNDASWNATPNFTVTSPVYSGSKALSFTVNAAWGALYLQTVNPVNTTGYRAIRFAAQASQANQRYALYLVDQNGQEIESPVLLVNYGGNPQPGRWTLYTIPLDSDNLNAAGKLVKGIVLQDDTGGIQPALYVDELGFTGTPTPTPTPTPRPSPSPSPTATPTPSASPSPSSSPAPSGSLVIYSDSLASGWTNASYSASVNYAVSNPVYAGSRSISVQITGAYGALDIHAGAAVNLSPYSTLNFAARASQAGQNYVVWLVDQNDNQVGNQLELAGYGGSPVAGTWKLYHIPFTDLGAAGQRISGVVV
ncbi:MAG: N,N-dimethylformamidase beta subunit family domain-containing protein, partial [Dehalococcoidia bacterium]